MQICQANRILTKLPLKTSSDYSKLKAYILVLNIISGDLNVAHKYYFNTSRPLETRFTSTKSTVVSWKSSLGLINVGGLYTIMYMFW